jgi:hypothetical protein
VEADVSKKVNGQRSTLTSQRSTGDVIQAVADVILGGPRHDKDTVKTRQKHADVLGDVINVEPTPSVNAVVNAVVDAVVDAVDAVGQRRRSTPVNAVGGRRLFWNAEFQVPAGIAQYGSQFSDQKWRSYAGRLLAERRQRGIIRSLLG